MQIKTEHFDTNHTSSYQGQSFDAPTSFNVSHFKKIPARNLFGRESRKISKKKLKSMSQFWKEKIISK